MTAHDSKIYEEIYKDRMIEIYEFCSAAGGTPSSRHFFVRVDGYQLPEIFDHVDYFWSDEYPEPTIPEESEALAAARAYCDRESEALEK